MDNETGTNENKSEVVDSSEQISENGCNEEEKKAIDSIKEKEDVAPEPEQSNQAQPKVLEEDKIAAVEESSEVQDVEEDNEKAGEVEESCLSSKESSPIDETLCEQILVTDSDNQFESSPEKSQSEAVCLVSSPSETECQESANDKVWDVSMGSSPGKSCLEAASIVSSPSETECEEMANEKNWIRMNVSGQAIYDDEADSDDDDDLDNDYNDRSSPKMDFKDRESNATAECPVFELTDDNSSVDDQRSENEDDIDGDDIEEEEEDMSDSSEVHNIDDSDDEPFVQNTNMQSMRRMPPSFSVKIDIKQPEKSFLNAHTFSDDAKYRKHAPEQRFQNHLKSFLQKYSASRLQRYFSIRRSIKCLNRDNILVDNRGVNRMVEVLNSGIDAGSSSKASVSKPTPVDASVLKERNINEANDSIKGNGHDSKESKTDDDHDCNKSKPQNTNELRKKQSDSHRKGNDLMMNLEFDDIDYDDKCAKTLTSEGDNDSQSALMDVDEPSESLYVHKKMRSQSDGLDAKIDDGIDDPVTIESDEESNKNSESPKNAVIVNGISKESTSANDKDSKSIDGNEHKTESKTNKRKISISSDEDQAPSAKHMDLDCLNDINENESKKPGSGGGIGPATSFIMSRCNMKSVDLAKEKSKINELHRNIQPKSSRSDVAATFASVVTQIPKSSPAIQAQHSFLSQRFRENGQGLLNSVNNQIDQSANNKLQIGRQGQIKDVQSIIANFRQTHPVIVPRRGRRLKNVNQGVYGNDQGSSSMGDNGDALVADLLSKRNNDISSPPSSNDSTYSNSQILLKAGSSNQFGSISAGNFKQAFNENNIGVNSSLKNNSLLTSTPLFKNQNSGIGYPEVTLHPIGHSSHAALLHSQKNNNDHLPEAHANSLLHGILTKSAKLKGSSTVTTGMTSSNNNTAGFNNAFSPTLARLLTAPERNFTLSSALSNNVGNSTNANKNNNNNNTIFSSNQTAGINLSKSSNSRSHQDANKPEISCLPISQILAFQQQQQPSNNSLLQQQLQRYQRNINKFLPKNNVLFNLDDEADDSDRLVIDEEQYSNSELIGGPSAKNDEPHENELPECQGCKKREAQFVCADCQRQWYCSRECQVMAWDEHSEVCAR